MPSVHKINKSKFWYGAFAVGGKRHFKSTKTKDKKQAEIICRKWELAGKKATSGRLTPDAAREVIAQGVAEIFVTAGGGDMPRATMRQWAELWLESKTIESETSTLSRYRGATKEFLNFIGKVADQDIEHVTSSHIEGFRNSVAGRLSAASANTSLKVVRALLSSAVSKQLLLRNPASASFVKTIDKEGAVKRRPLTIAEIKRIMAKADHEWKGMILMALYTGQRLGDVSRLTWRSIDLDADTISLTTQKTGRRMVIPLAKPLHSYIESLDSTDDPDAPLFPKIANSKTVAHLSNAFRDLLADAGLIERIGRKKTKNGRSSRRNVSEISFHSLRHSAVTFLKAAGASDVLAREIIGHDSAAVSRSYTHLATEDMRPAIDNLPDVTK